MKRYWDASALIDALHDSRVEQKALEPEQWTRPHALAEAFATLTGGRLGFRYLPDDDLNRRAQRSQRSFHSVLRALRDLLFTNLFDEAAEMRWQESRPTEADNMDVGPAIETDYFGSR
ncbi:hypothetical protein SBA7_1330003 [Candidatus Sulfotelmatobacter sp. SbA7]|nr:hypothetical protein SBA7_1330003 [Candidatus Sulfotelmatobacter sp. SbA7]